MTRRQAILSLLTAWSVCLPSTGCLFGSRRPDVDPPPEARGPTVAQEETVSSPWNPHPANPTFNPRNPPPNYQGTIFAEFFLPEPTPKPGATPEPPTVAGEPALPALSPVPAQEPDPPLVAALRRVLDKNPAEALELLKQYDQTTRDLLALLLPLTARIGEGGLDRASPQEAGALLEQLNDLTAALRARAPLSLKKVCFCRRINGFGDYEALPPNPEFQGGIDHRLGERVRIYAEVRNFRSVPKGNVYETQLVKSVEIHAAHDPTGNPIIIKTPDWTKPTLSYSPQQDYFLNIGFNLPPLPDGQYTLLVVVEDRTAFDGERVIPRLTRRSIDFRVSHGAGSHAGEGTKRRAAE
jgi:hypothetical protein